MADEATPRGGDGDVRTVLAALRRHPYSATPASPAFHVKDKSRRLYADILAEGAKMHLAGDAPLQCLEATFLALHVARRFHKALGLFPVRFVSTVRATGDTYRHMVLGYFRLEHTNNNHRLGGGGAGGIGGNANGPPVTAKFGAFGHSRLPGLASKPARYASLVALCEAYVAEYAAAGHDVRGIDVGALAPDPATAPPSTRVVWTAFSAVLPAAAAAVVASPPPPRPPDDAVVAVLATAALSDWRGDEPTVAAVDDVEPSSSPLLPGLPPTMPSLPADAVAGDGDAAADFPIVSPFQWRSRADAAAAVATPPATPPRSTVPA